MKTFRRKHGEVRAVQFTGRNDGEISEFVGMMAEHPVTTSPSWKIMGVGGWQEARVGDWIFQPIMTTVNCYMVLPNDAFKNMYEEVKEDVSGWETGSVDPAVGE